MKRLVIATMVLGATLLPAAGSTARPVLKDYYGVTSQGLGVAFYTGPHRRLDMVVYLRHVCSFGGTFSDNTLTEPSDHFHVARDGHFAITGWFGGATKDPPLARHGDRDRTHFVMKGRIVDGRVTGWVSEAIVLWRGHRQQGGCQTPPITFSAR